MQCRTSSPTEELFLWLYGCVDTERCCDYPDRHQVIVARNLRCTSSELRPLADTSNANLPFRWLHTKNGTWDFREVPLTRHIDLGACKILLLTHPSHPLVVVSALPNFFCVQCRLYYTKLSIFICYCLLKAGVHKTYSKSAWYMSCREPVSTKLIYRMLQMHTMNS